jgi:hypothetical protein
MLISTGFYNLYLKYSLNFIQMLMEEQIQLKKSSSYKLMNYVYMTNKKQNKLYRIRYKKI